MSGNNSDSILLQWLQRIAGGITALTGFVAGLVGFIQLVQGNADLATALLLTVGIGLLWSACLYYFRFWQPEAKDQGLPAPSAFQPEEERRQYAIQVDKFQRQQAQWQKRRKAIRRSALVGLIVIPLLSLAGVLTWQQVQNLPTNEVVILVAAFDGPEPQNYWVTETIISNLRDETEAYDDVKIATLNQPITEQDGNDAARAAGEKQKATIVIWGWYGKTAETVPISVNFEVLDPPAYFPEIGDAARGQVQTFALAELDRFQLQTRLSAEMPYLKLFTLGMARYVAEDWDGAIQFFTDALDQVNASVTALTQGIAYFYRGNSQYFQTQYEQAIADYSQALQIDPKAAFMYTNRGIAHAAQGNYEQAIADFNQAIQLDPEDAFAYIDRGIAYDELGKYEQAIADYSQAIQLNPEAADAYYNRANAYFDQGKYEQTIADYSQAIQLNPDDADAYYNRGIAYDELGKYEQAIADYSQAIRINPEAAFIYTNRGIAYSSQGNYEQAIADFNQAIQINPDDAIAYYNRGIAYEKLDEYEQAIADYSQVIQLDPEYADAYYNRGIAYEELGEYKQAIADYGQAIQLDPDDADAYNNRGIAHAEQGHYEQAIADFTQTIQLDPEYTFAYNNRGGLLTKR